MADTDIHTTAPARTGTIAGRMAAIAAVIGGTAWLVKQLAIVASDGAESIPVAIGWTVGMVGFLLACAAFVFAFLRRYHVIVRLISAVAAVPLAFMALNMLDIVLKSVYQGGGWFRDELALVVTGAVLLAAGAWWLLGRSAGPTDRARNG